MRRVVVIDRLYGTVIEQAPGQDRRQVRHQYTLYEVLDIYINGTLAGPDALRQRLAITRISHYSSP